MTLNYKRVLYVLDPTDASRAARRQRVRIEEQEDGSLRFWHGEHELRATAFPKGHSVRQGEVIENTLEKTGHLYFAPTLSDPGVRADESED